MPEIVVVGEALVEIARDRSEFPGGSSANVAMALGRLGHVVLFRTALGNDHHGELIRSWLASSNVHISESGLSKTSTVSQGVVTLGDPSWHGDLTWTLDEASIPSSSAVHVGSIGAWYPPGTWRVEALLERARTTSTISFDPAIRPGVIRNPDDVRMRVGRILRLSDVVKVSDVDLFWLRPEESMRQVAREWLGEGVALVVVTLGAAGAVAYTREHEVQIPGTTVKVVDARGPVIALWPHCCRCLLAPACLVPTGGERLAHLSADRLRAILTGAANAAAISVARRGFDPPWANELPI